MRVEWKPVSFVLNILRHFRHVHRSTSSISIAHHFLFEILRLFSRDRQLNWTWAFCLSGHIGIKSGLSNLLISIVSVRLICDRVVKHLTSCGNQAWNRPIWVDRGVFHSLHMFPEVEYCLNFRCIVPRTVINVMYADRIVQVDVRDVDHLGREDVLLLWHFLCISVSTIGP